MYNRTAMMLQAIYLLAIIKDINIEIILQEEKQTLIGKRMYVRDNSYLCLCDDKEVSGRLCNKVVEIVSEPYKEDIMTFGNTYTHTFVNVRSLDSGLFYRVLFSEDDVIDNDKEAQDGVLGRKIKVNDNSYSQLLGTDVHPLIYGETLVIISEPYIETVGYFGNKHLFVNAIGKRGNIYRILFNEDGLIED